MAGAPKKKVQSTEGAASRAFRITSEGKTLNRSFAVGKRVAEPRRSGSFKQSSGTSFKRLELNVPPWLRWLEEQPNEWSQLAGKRAAFDLEKLEVTATGDDLKEVARRLREEGTDSDSLVFFVVPPKS